REEFGLDIELPDYGAQEVAERLRVRATRPLLAAALVDWAVTKMKAALLRSPAQVAAAMQSCERLRDLAQRVDLDSPWHERFHAAFASPFSVFRGEFGRLAEAADAGIVPTIT